MCSGSSSPGYSTVPSGNSGTVSLMVSTLCRFAAAGDTSRGYRLGTPEPGQRAAEHVVVVAADLLDEPAAPAVQRERARHLQRLAAGDVRVDLGRARLAEPDHC